MAERKSLSELFTWRSAICDSALPSTTRHVALTLSLHMSERGDSCFPSVTTLAEETDLNRRTVQRHLRKLEEECWIEQVGWAPRSTPGGEQRTKKYRASIPKGAAENRPPDPKGAAEDTKGAALSTKGGGTEPPKDVQEDDKEDEVQSSSGLRPSPGEPGEGEEDDELDALAWYRSTPEAEKPPTRHWNEGVTALWRPTDEQIQAQGGWPACSSYLKRLAEDYGASWEEVSAFVVGSRLLVDAGEVGGVEPGASFFYGLPQDSETWDGATWWSRAREAFREWWEARSEPAADLEGLFDGVAEVAHAG